MKPSILVKSSQQVESDEKAQIQLAEQDKKPVMKNLASYVQTCFESAKNHRKENDVNERMLRSKRQKAGEYEQTELAQLQSRPGTDIFFNITESKCESFVAWLEDIFSPVKERPWAIEPTPIPTISEGSAELISEKIASMVDGEMATLGKSEDVVNETNRLYDEALRDLKEDAEQKAEYMADLMDDQLQEGGWPEALSDFIADLSVYPTAFIKGPEILNKKRISWENGEIKTTIEAIPNWKCVDPLDIYPSPNARNLHEGYLCELTKYDRSALALLRKQEGWNEKNIDALTGISYSQNADSEEYSSGIGDASERSRLEDRNLHSASSELDDKIEVIEFWGPVSGTLLLEWGMSKKDVPVAEDFYEVNCVMANHLILKSVLNPDPIGRRPYYSTSYIKNKNSVWGLKSIPEKMQDTQRGVNGAQRALLNNLAIASGPQVVANVDVISEEQLHDIHNQGPWKVYAINGNQQTNNVPPVSFFQPNSNSNELVAVTQFYEGQADDRTLIPRYVAGNTDAGGGAGSTASGLSMLMNAANRGIKRVVKNIDMDIIRPMLNQLYTRNMIFEEDDKIKGDAQVVPKGVLASLAADQVQLRRTELLNFTNNPTDLQIMGVKGRAELLRKVAGNIDMDISKIIPSNEELMQMQQAQDQAQQNEEEMQQEGQPPME